MRVAVNARLFIKDRIDGIGRYAWETTSRLVLAHPEIRFYFFFDRPWDDLFILAPNVFPVLVSPPCRHPLLFYIWFEWRLPQLFRKHKIDVFYSPDGFLSLSSGTPTLLVSHDLAYLHYPEYIPIMQRWYYKIFVKRFHLRADHIIAVSQFTKTDIINQFEISQHKTSVAYNALSGKFLREDRSENFSSSIPYFVFVGTLHPRKNIGTILDAFDHFKDKTGFSHQLLLIGSCMWNCKEFENRINSSSWANDIHHIHGMNDDELIQKLKYADAMLYPSRFEGFGIPIIEAMALGVPVITSNVSSMPEVAGDAAILVKPDNFEEISDAMQKIISNLEFRKDLIMKAEENIKRFSWRDTTDHIYEKLLMLYTNRNTI
jgi:glycosyltransferase involved in cell wall biosynthesis